MSVFLKMKLSVWPIYTGAWNGLVLTCCKYCVFPAVRQHSFSFQITDCTSYLFTFHLVVYFNVRC
jgi:hypothetical protein